MIPWLMSACFYPCIVGPDFWGLVNKHWRMCTTGQMQSPINVDPSVLLYDPGLLPLAIDKHQVFASNIYNNYCYIFPVATATSQYKGFITDSCTHKD